MWISLVGCVVGQVQTPPNGPEPVVHDPVSSPTAEPPEGTQIGDEGTQTCAPEILELDAVLDTGVTVADVLGVLRAEVVAPTWFDGRAADLDVELIWLGGDVTRDMGCEVQTEVEVRISTADGAIDQVFVTPGTLSSRGVSAWTNLAGTAWTGTLTGFDVGTPSCPDGETWRVSVDQDDTSSGDVSHGCDGTIQGGEDKGGGGGGGGGGGDTGTDTTSRMADDSGNTGEVIYVDPPREVMSW